MTRQWFSVRNERGQALALVAVTVVGLLAMMSLAIDLSMMYKTRAEAQRAADAAALAGASVFQEPIVPSTVDSAHARARTLADTNYMQGGNIDVSTCTKGGDELLCPEMTVLVLPDSFKVRVWIYRKRVGTFFASVLRIFNVQIGAMAAAEATAAGAGNCLKPFIFPDYWADNTGEDENTNTLWDLPTAPPQGKLDCGVDMECWEYTDGSDGYYQYNDTTVAASAWTGLNTDWRNNAVDPNTGHKYYQDIGRPVILYPSLPQDSPTPSNFYLWRITCPGGNCVQEAICDDTGPGFPQECGCVTAPVAIGDTLDAEEQPGQVQGPVSQGIKMWLDTDRSATFVSYPDGQGYQQGSVVSSIPGKSGYSNPRVFIAAIMDPFYLRPGQQLVPILNLARFFLESGPETAGDKSPMIVRFLGYAGGFAPDSNTGTLVKVLRLVE
jgi:hypothetical protein